MCKSFELDLVCCSTRNTVVVKLCRKSIKRATRDQCKFVLHDMAKMAG